MPWIKRAIFVVLISIVPGYMSSLSRRMCVLEIGLTGHVSDFDRMIADREQLKPLNRFERWLLEEFISAEIVFRREAFRKSVREVTGEEI